MASIEKVWMTKSGAILFNAVTQLKLVDKEGHRLLFSRRKELTLHIIGLLLEAGYTPEELADHGEEEQAPGRIGRGGSAG